MNHYPTKEEWKVGTIEDKNACKKWRIKEKKKGNIQIFCKKRTKTKKEKTEAEENNLNSIQIMG